MSDIIKLLIYIIAKSCKVIRVQYKKNEIAIAISNLKNL